MTVVDDARDVGLHHGTAEGLVLDPFADRRCDEVRAGEKDRAGAFDDVRLVAHDRQVGAAGDARADDRRHLEDAGRGEAGVVVEDPAVVLAVGEDLVLHRQEDPGRVDEIDHRQAVFERDLLRPQDLLDAERELRSGLDGGVVRDDHHVAAVDAADAGHHSRCRRAAPLGVHAVGRPEAELEKGRARVAERRDPLARRQLALFVLAGLRLRAAARAQLCLLRGQPGDLSGPVLLSASERLVDLQRRFDGRQCDLPWQTGRLYGPAEAASPAGELSMSPWEEFFRS